MPFTPEAGKTAIIKTAFNSTNTTLAAINWTLAIDPKAKDVSNFRDGRFRVKTLQDATLSFTVVHDSTAPEYLVSGGALIDGQIIQGICFPSSNTNTSTAFLVPAMVTSVSVKNDSPEGAVMYDVTASLHNGTVTYPTA